MAALRAISTRTCWCFTLNNYTAQEEQELMQLECKYIIFGREIGSEGTKHLQGYIRFTKRMSLRQLKQILGNRVHLEIRRGTEQQAAEYCKKDGDFFEKGEPSQQGKRTDILTLKRKIASGKTFRELRDDIKSYQHLKFAECWYRHFEPKRMCVAKPIIRWYWGPTGSGKTRAAIEEMPECWMSSKDLRWWDGYDGHEHILIDDFRESFCTFEYLLRVLDRYPMRVECKGSSRQLKATMIIITSSFHPSMVYGSKDDVKQLLRRIDVIKEFLVGL